MIKSVGRILVAFGLSGGVNCAAPTPYEAGTGLIRTEAQVYRATTTASSVRLTVVATFTNTTLDTLVLHPCYQGPPYPLAVSMQRNEGGVWKNVLSPYCTLALMFDPPPLAPGQARTDTIHLEGFRLPHTAPSFPPGAVAGLYRLKYSWVYRTWHPRHPTPSSRDSQGEPLPDSLLVSNPFRVKD